MRCVVHSVDCRHKVFAGRPANQAVQAVDANCPCELVVSSASGDSYLRTLVCPTSVSTMKHVAMKVWERHAAVRLATSRRERVELTGGRPGALLAEIGIEFLG